MAMVVQRDEILQLLQGRENHLSLHSISTRQIIYLIVRLKSCISQCNSSQCTKQEKDHVDSWRQISGNHRSRTAGRQRPPRRRIAEPRRSEEHTSELQSLM